MTSVPETPSPARAITTKNNGIVIFSGGSAANTFVDVFDVVAKAHQSSLHYVIPISDNGGSSSELIRVFGGPGIGDLRSRLVRLIPATKDGITPDPEAAAIKHFFNHRLCPDGRAARHEWLDILESTHALWMGISTPKKELIRSFLNVVNTEVVKRLRPSSRFDFTNASVGNLFLTGARLFTGSLESAIYMLSSICSVPASISVLPVINSNFAHHISAGLEDGTVITGQNNISHPSENTSLRSLEPDAATMLQTQPQAQTQMQMQTQDEQDRVEDANMPGTLPDLRKNAINFTKTAVARGDDDLPSRIARVWYINPYGQEIRLPPNPRVLDALSDSSTVIYSIGSLFTSIVPSLVLKHVGRAISNPAIRSKVLILNATIDRETGPSTRPFTAMDFVAAIATACFESMHGAGAVPKMDDYAQFVTHVIYAEGPCSPKLAKEDFDRAGIAVFRITGRTIDGELRYNGESLRGALNLVIGRRDMGAEKGRRNTIKG